MSDEDIINAYFADPAVRDLLDKELGVSGKITVDWIKRKVRAQGRFAGKEWDLDEMLAMLKKQVH